MIFNFISVASLPGYVTKHDTHFMSSTSLIWTIVFDVKHITNPTVICLFIAGLFHLGDNVLQ